MEAVSKPSIRSKVKAEPGIQAQEYISILSIESSAPTPKVENGLGQRGGFETVSKLSWGYLDGTASTTEPEA